MVTYDRVDYYDSLDSWHLHDGPVELWRALKPPQRARRDVPSGDGVLSR